MARPPEVHPNRGFFGILRWGDHAGDDLLIVNGEEVTTRSGHWPAWGLPAGTWIDWRYRAEEPREFRRFADDVHRVGGLVVAAHPFAPCGACSWEFGFEHADLVEVWNGPWTLDDEASVIAWDGALRQGRYIPADGLRTRKLLDGFRGGSPSPRPCSWVSPRPPVIIPRRIVGAAAYA